MIALCVAVSAHSFSDVPAGAWYESYVSHVYEAGVMEGKADGVFDPEGTVTRAEFVTVMARLSGEGLTGYEENVSAFPDADSSAWYAPYMGWGIATGLVKGQGNGSLSPASPVSRAEMVTFMARLMDYMGVTISDSIIAEEDFSDVDEDAYYAEALDTLRRCALITGDGAGKFNPAATTQRHSVAALISRYLDAVADMEEGNADFSTIFGTNIPVITIVTETGRDVESKEDYIRAEFTLKGEDGRDINIGSMRIRGRGNATWKMEKKSYRLKFDDNVCLMHGEAGDTKNKDWTLLANHCDKSLIRNHVAQSLGRELDGIEWAPYTELVEVYLNGEYRGIYMLCEQVEVGDQRVDIEDGEKDDIGFLIELDGYAEGEYNKDMFTVFGQKYTVKSDIKDENQVIAMKLHLEVILNTLIEGDPDKVKAVVDIDSILDMYILQETMRNLDAGWSSFFLYFYEPHGKLYFGPPWDFDLSSGNSYNCHERQGLYVGHKTTKDGDYLNTTNQWFAALLSHKWFREMVRDRFNEKKDDMIKVVSNCCNYAYANMDKLDRNFEKWDIFDEIINQEPVPVIALKSCRANVDYLATWFVDRFAWLTDFYNSDKFMDGYECPEMEYGVTETVDADVWTIPDWFEGDKMTQIYMDILFDSSETEDGRIFARMGLTATLTPDNVAKVLLEKQLGAEPGRYTFTFDPDAFNEMKSFFSGLGIGQGVIWEFTYTIKDKVTGEESYPTTQTFVFIKDDPTWKS
ncbi:MAG: CotH kinase family protein [Clostridia bacterium]|nr:CotH kinase family protein [Clostridia bacterium]